MSLSRILEFGPRTLNHFGFFVYPHLDPPTTKWTADKYPLAIDTLRLKHFTISDGFLNLRPSHIGWEISSSKENVPANAI
jgi:hypothetical protein